MDEYGSTNRRIRDEDLRRAAALAYAVLTRLRMLDVNAPPLLGNQVLIDQYQDALQAAQDLFIELTNMESP